MVVVARRSLAVRPVDLPSRSSFPPVRDAGRSLGPVSAVEVREGSVASAGLVVIR